MALSSIWGNGKTIVCAALSPQESNLTPTSNLFAVDYVTGEIQEYFFEQLNQCDIERFKALSAEKDETTIYSVREAETILQSEFEGFHEPNSITRPTKAELQKGNVLDVRFRTGLLSGESNTLKEQYTNVDAKLLISDTNLQYQADRRRILGHKNPNKLELPSSSDNVKHIINTLELIPSETEIAKAGVVDGAKIV